MCGGWSVLKLMEDQSTFKALLCPPPATRHKLFPSALPRLEFSQLRRFSLAWTTGQTQWAASGGQEWLDQPAHAGSVCVDPGVRSSLGHHPSTV